MLQPLINGISSSCNPNKQRKATCCLHNHISKDKMSLTTKGKCKDCRNPFTRCYCNNFIIGYIIVKTGQTPVSEIKKRALPPFVVEDFDTAVFQPPELG